MVSKIHNSTEIHQETVTFIIAGHVPAFNQLWILGDSLLKNTISCLQALKTAYINDPLKPRLYIHDHYDVIPHFDDSNAKENFLWQIQNNLAYLLKVHYKLPQKIIIILNNSVLDDPAFATTQLASLLKWLFKEIEAAINLRRKNLPIRCLKKGEPAVFLLKLLPRASRAEEAEMFKSTRRKVNSQIPTIMEKFEYGFINVCEITTSNSLMYDRSGKNLAPAGIVQFWESISQTVKEINEQKQAKIQESKDKITIEKVTNAQIPKSPRRQLPLPPPPTDNQGYHRRSYPSQNFQSRRYNYDYNYDYNRFHYSAQRKY